MSPPSFDLTRRGALTGLMTLSSAAAVSSAGALSRDDGDDDIVHAASAEFWDAQRLLDELERIPDPPFGTLAMRDVLALRDRQNERQDAAMWLLAETAAREHRGIALKAAIVMHTLPFAMESFELDAEMPELQLALSLARDVERLG